MPGLAALLPYMMMAGGSMLSGMQGSKQQTVLDPESRALLQQNRRYLAKTAPLNVAYHEDLARIMGKDPQALQESFNAPEPGPPGNERRQRLIRNLALAGLGGTAGLTLSSLLRR